VSFCRHPAVNTLSSTQWIRISERLIPVFSFFTGRSARSLRSLAALRSGARYSLGPSVFLSPIHWGSSPLLITIANRRCIPASRTFLYRRKPELTKRQTPYYGPKAINIIPCVFEYRFTAKRRRAVHYHNVKRPYPIRNNECIIA